MPTTAPRMLETLEAMTPAERAVLALTSAAVGAFAELTGADSADFHAFGAAMISTQEMLIDRIVRRIADTTP